MANSQGLLFGYLRLVVPSAPLLFPGLLTNPAERDRPRNGTAIPLMGNRAAFICALENER
jgi:hypothetical protein